MIEEMAFFSTYKRVLYMEIMIKWNEFFTYFIHKNERFLISKKK